MKPSRVKSIAHLRLLLTYDPDSGILTWNPRPEGMFSSPRHGKTWNTRYANTKAFTAILENGYHTGSIDGKSFLAHRVIWAMHYDAWPTDLIDHVNGVKTDNRISNLRMVVQQENSRNSQRRSNNTSGVTGVYWNKKDKRWMSRIKVDRQYLYLGSFLELPDAIAARKAAEIQYGFHPNHDREGPLFPNQQETIFAFSEVSHD